MSKERNEQDVTVSQEDRNKSLSESNKMYERMKYDIIDLIQIVLTIPILGMLFLTSEKHIGCTIASFVLWGVAAIIIAVYHKIYLYAPWILDRRLSDIIKFSYMASPIFSLVAFILAIIAVAV